MSTNPAADASTRELEHVLSDPVAELQERERTAFDHQAGGHEFPHFVWSGRTGTKNIGRLTTAQHIAGRIFRQQS